MHVLRGADPVFEWISSTAARPVLAALPGDLCEQFTADYKATLREAYPELLIGGEPGTIRPFKRVFAVARRI